MEPRNTPIASQCEIRSTDVSALSVDALDRWDRTSLALEFGGGHDIHLLPKEAITRKSNSAHWSARTSHVLNSSSPK